MSYTNRPLEDLDVLDDFLMNAAASDAEVGELFCRTLLKGLLQRDFGKIQVSVQRIIPPNNPKRRGIRMDVQVQELEDTDNAKIKNIYDLEPNRNPAVNLPRHNRFYQAKIDSRQMKSGEKNFTKLPNLFVITITDYDPFGYDYMLYTVKNQCQEVPELLYEDGLLYLYFNTKGKKGGNTSIKHLLDYLERSKMDNVKDEATKQLHHCISKVKLQEEVRAAYMTWEDIIYYERQEAKDEGKAEGKLEGKLEEKANSILELLEDYSPIPENITSKIQCETDIEVLKRWLKLAAKATSLEEFQSTM